MMSRASDELVSELPNKMAPTTRTGLSTAQKTVVVQLINEIGRSSRTIVRQTNLLTGLMARRRRLIRLALHYFQLATLLVAQYYIENEMVSFLGRAAF